MYAAYPRSERATRSLEFVVVSVVELREVRRLVSLGTVALFAVLLREPIVEVSVLLLRVELFVSVVLEPAIEPVLLGLELAAPLVLLRGVLAVLPLGAVCVFVLGPGVSFADGGLVFLPVSLIAPEPVVEPLLLVWA